MLTTLVSFAYNLIIRPLRWETALRAERLIDPSVSEANGPSVNEVNGPSVSVTNGLSESEANGPIKDKTP